MIKLGQEAVCGMKYVIAARYNEKGERITEEEKEHLVLDCQTAREIVAQLNSRVTAADTAGRKPGDRA